jgi:hypothetical protein
MEGLTVVHLSHVGPLAIPNGGVMHIQESIKLELEQNFNVKWFSYRMDREEGYKKHADHLRLKTVWQYSPQMFGDSNLSFQVATSSKARNHLIENLNKLKDYVLVFEGPWMWPLFQTIQHQIRYQPKEIVYSCHNVECIVLPQIYQSRNLSPEKLQLASTLLRLMEREIISRADICIALTNSDALELKNLGAKRIILASNGAIKPPEAIKPAKRIKKRLSDNLPVVLFVSSNWDPHVHGLQQFIDAIASESAALNVVIVGSIKNSFENRLNKVGELKIPSNESRIWFTGRVDNDRLAQIYGISDAIILTVEFGGGKGIKTSEALLTGKPVFATSASVRGFDRNMLENNVYIHESSYDLVKSILQNLSDAENIEVGTNDKYSQLTWKSALSPWTNHLCEFIANMR